MSGTDTHVSPGWPAVIPGLSVDDPEKLVHQAIDLGAAAVEALAEMPYGDRRAMIRDQWSDHWQVAMYRGFGGAS